MNQQFVGAIRIKDGLFMGDEYSARDWDFMLMNRIGRVVNCCQRQVPNLFERQGIGYLSLPWPEVDNHYLGESARPLAKTFSFLETALEQGEQVLVHSLRNQNRSALVILLYLMKKFRWSLPKATAFLRFRKPDLDTRKAVLAQLGVMEGRLAKTVSLTSSWTVTPLLLQEDSEELVLVHTYLNCHDQHDWQGMHTLPPHDEESSRKRLRWADQNKGHLLQSTLKAKRGTLVSILKGEPALKKINNFVKNEARQTAPKALHRSNSRLNTSQVSDSLSHGSHSRKQLPKQRVNNNINISNNININISPIGQQLDSLLQSNNQIIESILHLDGSAPALHKNQPKQKYSLKQPAPRKTLDRPGLKGLRGKQPLNNTYNNFFEPKRREKPEAVLSTKKIYGPQVARSKNKPSRPAKQNIQITGHNPESLQLKSIKSQGTMPQSPFRPQTAPSQQDFKSTIMNLLNLQGGPEAPAPVPKRPNRRSFTPKGDAKYFRQK